MKLTMEAASTKGRSNSRHLAPLLKRWDAALVSWRTAIDTGSTHLVEIANSATAMGHLAKPPASVADSGKIKRGLSSAMIASAEASIYERMQLEYRAILVATDTLATVTNELDTVAAAVLNLDSEDGSAAINRETVTTVKSPSASIHTSQTSLNSPLTTATDDEPTFLTHGTDSLGTLLADCAASYRAQQAACADVAQASSPDSVRASSSNALNL